MCIVNACSDNCKVTTLVVAMKNTFTKKCISTSRVNLEVCGAICSSLIVDVSNISLKVWYGKSTRKCWFPKLSMINFNGYETWLHFGSKHGCNSNILLNLFFFHFQIKLVLHIDEEICVKILDLALNPKP